MLRDAVLILLLVAALVLGGFGFVGLMPLALAFCVAAAAILYVRAGRWQAMPAAGTAALLGLAGLIGAGAGLPVWIVAAMALLTAGSTAMLILFPIPHLPRPSGDNGVGLAHILIEGGRRFPVYVWYPAKRTPSARTRPFHTQAEAYAIRDGLAVTGAPRFLYDHFRLARTSTVMDAPMREGKHPVVIFNHGGALFPTQNFSLMEALASHGVICIAVSHPGESLGVAWPNQTTTAILPEVLEAMKESSTFQRANVRYPLDTSPANRDANFAVLRSFEADGLVALANGWARDSLDVLACLDRQTLVGGQSLAGAVDTQRLAYAGMSLGGAAAMRCCYLDPKAKAGANLDGLNRDWALADRPLTLPFLQLYSDPNLMRKQAANVLGEELPPIALEGQLTMYNDRFFDRSAGRANRFVFPGIGHMAFTDLPRAFGRCARGALGFGGRASPASIDAINHLVTAFLLDKLLDRSGEASGNPADKDHVPSVGIPLQS